MGRDDQKEPGEFPSLPPPETKKIDSGWDDDLDLSLPLVDASGEDSGERITAVPEIPMSDFARSVMAQADSATSPETVSRPPATGVEESSSSPSPLRGDLASRAGRTPFARQPDSGTDPFDPDRTAPPSPQSTEFSFNEGDWDDTPTEPPLSEDPLPSTTPGQFDFSDISRDEMPTLDISEGVDSVLGSETDSDEARDTTPDDVELDFSEFRDSADPPSTKPSGSPRLPIGEKTGLELDDVPPPKDDEDAAHKELRDRYAVGDFTGALIIADSILEQDPDDIEAARYSQSCRDVLMQMYSARLGSLDQVVSVAIPPEQIRWLSLDHRAGFLLSLVDGSSSVDDILDICGMARLDALRIMYQLLEQRVISIGQR